MAKFFLFPALIKSVQNCPIASEPLIGCTPGGIKTASLVYSAGNAFPFKLLYAADHSLFAASIAALILSWAHAIGAVNSTTKMAEDIAFPIFMALPPLQFSFNTCRYMAAKTGARLGTAAMTATRRRIRSPCFRPRHDQCLLAAARAPRAATRPPRRRVRPAIPAVRW